MSEFQLSTSERQDPKLRFYTETGLIVRQQIEIEPEDEVHADRLNQLHESIDEVRSVRKQARLYPE